MTTKQYRVVKVSNHWSLEKLREKVELTLNDFSKKGWALESIHFLDSVFVAMITFSK